jgi:competence protein ComEA
VSSLPPFIVPPPDDWRSRLRGLLLGTGRQRRPLAVLAVVALAVGVLTWRELRPQQLPAPAEGGPVTAADVQAAATPTPAPPTAQATAQGSAPGTVVFVHVTGRVRRPGILELPAGSRVADAVGAAGGVTAGADLDRVNLARRLTDGEQVHVPAQGEPIVAAPPGPGGTGDPAAGQPIDLNTATLEQLQSLPGIGEVTAERIIAHREQQPFRSVEDLLDVPGIGERKLEDIRDLVVVG